MRKSVRFRLFLTFNCFEKIALPACAVLLFCRALNPAAAERTGHDPTRAARVHSRMNAVQITICGDRARTELGFFLSTGNPPAMHELPAVLFHEALLLELVNASVFIGHWWSFLVER
jgi:hypothetical protein